MKLDLSFRWIKSLKANNFSWFNLDYLLVSQKASEFGEMGPFGLVGLDVYYSIIFGYGLEYGFGVFR